MNEVGVDVPGLTEIAEFHLFDQEEEISFSTFLELVLQLRGSNTVCVRDIVNLRKFIIEEMANSEDRIMQNMHRNGRSRGNLRGLSQASTVRRVNSNPRR